MTLTLSHFVYASDSNNANNDNIRPEILPQNTTVEQSGLCKGLDLSITADIRNCLNRQYKIADRLLNNIYKQLMTRLGEPRKSSLKKEQIAWIKEKEKTCKNAGKESEGGTLEPVMIADCEVEMTQQRVIYLKSIQ